MIAGDWVGIYCPKEHLFLAGFIAAIDIILEGKDKGSNGIGTGNKDSLDGSDKVIEEDVIFVDIESYCSAIAVGA